MMSESVLADAYKNQSQATLLSISPATQIHSFCGLLAGSQIVSNKSQASESKKYRHSKKIGFQNANEKRGSASQADVELMYVRKLLASSLDALDVGLEIWDEEDRLVLYNQKINQLQAGFHKPENIGKNFRELLYTNISKQLIKVDHAAEQEWLTHRFCRREKLKQPLLHELADDRWANTYESRTPEDYLIVAWVDVTELVRKGRILEAINRELFHQSTTDGLTGLANRRRFDEVLAIEQKQSNCLVLPISLLMVDIDHFKNYNDHYGHAQGDICLRRVATILNECARRTGDLVARYGGEEFVILLPGSDSVRAREIATKCLSLIQEEAIPHANSPIFDRISLSLGIASLSANENIDGDLLLKAADSALYRAKRNGRACFAEANESDWNRNNSVMGINLDRNQAMAALDRLTAS
jgi:diguanylate cyclase (GGDEF)-like protein